MSDPRILTVRPQPVEYAWTFGGAPPVARIAPGYGSRPVHGGLLRRTRAVREGGLVSEVCEFPFLNPQDAYQFATQTVESPLANMCDTNYTCVAKLRKQWLLAHETHRGIHARLRETATALRR